MQREEIKTGFLKVPPSWLQHLLNKVRPWVGWAGRVYVEQRIGGVGWGQFFFK